MENKIRELDTIWNIGDPVVVVRDGFKIYGRVSELFGSEAYSPQRPMIIIETPHGSKIETGVFWAHHPNEEEMCKLREYEDLATKEKETKCGERPQGHDKVYSSNVLLTNPPQFQWICENCGCTGTSPGYTYEDRYEEVRRRFEK